MSAPALFLVALLVGWVRLRLIRSKWFWRAVAWPAKPWRSVKAFTSAAEAVLYTKHGRLRRRSEIMRDATERFGVYLVASTIIEQWKVGRGPKP